MRKLLLTVGFVVAFTAPASAQNKSVYAGGFGDQVSLWINGSTLLGSYDQGWYQGAFHATMNPSYYTGQSGGYWYHSFFTFDMTGVGVVTSAALYIKTQYVVDGPSTVNFYDFIGNQNDLLNGTGGGAAYGDLGTGTFYGSRYYTSADDNTYQYVNLNADAITDINNASSLWTMGGALSDDPDAGPGADSVTPEPVSMVLLGSGLAGIAGVRRRKKRTAE